MTNGSCRPAELLAGRGDFLRAERRAVRRFGALLVRRTAADDGLAADQARADRVSASAAAIAASIASGS